MTPFYNLGSLLLGLAAWALGFAAILCRKQWPKVMFASFACCGVSLVFQFFEIRHRILIGDWSAIEDIYPTMAWVTLILLVGTLTLNGIVLLKKRK